MVARVNEVIAELKANPPPVPVGDIAEAIQFLEWLNANNFTLLGVQEYTVAADHDLQPVPDSGLGLLRQQRPADPAARRPGRHRHAGNPGVLQRAEDADRHQGQRQVARASPRLHGLHRREALQRRRRRLRRIPHRRAVHLRRLHAPGAHHSVSAAQDRRHRAPRRLRSRRPFRQGAGQCSGDLSARRAVPDRRGHALSQFALAILQIEERPRVRVLARRDRFDRFVSVLVYAPRERYDTRVRQAIGEYLAEVFNGRVSAFYPWFPDGPLVRVHFIIGRDAGETPNPDRETLEEAVSAIVRTWTDALSEALSDAFPGACARDVRALSRRVLGGLSRGLFADRSGGRHSRHRRTVGGSSARRRFLSQGLGQAGLRRPRSVEPRPPDPAVGARAGAREHGLPRGRRAHLSGRSCRRQRSLVPRHDAGVRRRHRERSRSAAARPRSAVHRDHARLCARTTATTRSRWRRA